MDMKRCLFCDQIVPIRLQDEYEWYDSCYCAIGQSYGLRSDSYESFHALSYQAKAQNFPILSAYIRELTDCGETVTLSIDDMDTIRNSPRVPTTIEDKGNRLLHYLHRHSKGPNEPVIIHQLSVRYNLTYSPNLQEMIYIIETLKELKLIERAGSTLKLTDKGWAQAAATTWGQRLKPCVVLHPEEEGLREEWIENVFPKIEQCGYLPRKAEPLLRESYNDTIMRLVTDSKLLIADLTIPSPDVYYAAGYARGLQIPVIWTVRQSEAARVAAQFKQIRPVIWTEAEQLADMLQQHLVV